MLVAKSWARLANSSAGQYLELLSPGAEGALRDGLRNRLMFTGGQTVRFYSSAASAASFHATSGGRSSPQCDERTFARERQMLFRHYPGLRAVWRTQLTRWRSTTAKFLAAAYSFAEIRDADALAGCVEEIETDLSDPHDGNQSVTSVRFRGCGAWFYKPRSGEREQLFAILLHHLSEAGFPLQFISPEIVATGAAHWSRKVEQAACRRSSEVENFFHRAGGLLYVLHSFRAVDVHAGNLVAHRSYPVIIDCETLLHPDGRLPEAYRFEDESLLRVGMLPIGSRGDGDVSALGARNRGPHMPLLHDTTANAADFIPQIVAGFREMHRVIRRMGLTRGSLASLTMGLRASRTRLVLRPSAAYYRILVGSFDPLYLQTEAGRPLFLDRCCDSDIVTAAQRRAEVTALQRADIPRLMATPCQPRELSDGEVASAIQQIRRSLERGAS